MTLLVCHRDTGVVTLLADTRISGQIGALTDIGPKVMSVPVVVASGSGRLVRMSFLRDGAPSGRGCCILS